MLNPFEIQNLTSNAFVRQSQLGLKPIFLNVGQSWPLFIYFCPFHVTIKYNLKIRKCGARDLNPESQESADSKYYFHVKTIQSAVANDCHTVLCAKNQITQSMNILVFNFI